MKNAFLPTKPMLDCLENVTSEITTFAILEGLETTYQGNLKLHASNQLNILEGLETNYQGNDSFYTLADGKMVGNYLFDGYTDKTILSYNEEVTKPSIISGIRLGTYFSDKDPNWHILEKVPNSPELYLATYHEYITDLAPKSIQKKLESLYEKGKLKLTGKTYTSATNELQVIEYKQKKYVRFPISNHLFQNTTSIISSDTYVCEQDFYWLEVEPLEFIVNIRTGLALTKKIIYATLTDNINNDLLATILSKITGMKEEVKETINSKSDITELINEIKELTKNDEYLAKKVSVEVNQILEDYNKRIKELKENLQNNRGLTLIVETKETVKIDLIVKLTNIINKLKQYQEENKEYYKMIAILDYYLQIVNGEIPNNKELNNDLGFDLYQIILALSSLKDIEKEKIMEDMIGVLSKKRIAIRKKQISQINETGYEEETEELNFDTLEELILEIRKLIHPILITLNKKVENSAIQEEITTGIKNIIAGIYTRTNNNYISYYLYIINDLVRDLQILLREIPNKDNDQDILNEILNLEIDYSQNVLIILKELQHKIITLYKLKLEIESYLNEQKSYDALIYKRTL